jgi:hypothetical protein
MHPACDGLAGGGALHSTCWTDAWTGSPLWTDGWRQDHRRLRSAMSSALVSLSHSLDRLQVFGTGVAAWDCFDQHDEVR